jgi:hypothetical protein
MLFMSRSFKPLETQLQEIQASIIKETVNILKNDKTSLNMI